MALSLSNAIDATDDFVRPPPRHRRCASVFFLFQILDRKYRPRDGGTLKASWDAEKRTGGKGGGDGGTAPRRAALDSDEAEMGSRAGEVREAAAISGINYSKGKRVTLHVFVRP